MGNRHNKNTNKKDEKLTWKFRISFLHIFLMSTIHRYDLSLEISIPFVSVIYILSNVKSFIFLSYA